MCIYFCIDAYMVKPECCNVKSPMLRKLSHGLATIVHFAILGISSALIYYGKKESDLLLIIPYSISVAFLIWILLCSLCGFGCSNIEENLEENESLGSDVIEIEAIDADGDCSMMRTYAFEILLILHGIILGIAQGRAPVSAK